MVFFRRVCIISAIFFWVAQYIIRKNIKYYLIEEYVPEVKYNSLMLIKKIQFIDYLFGVTGIIRVSNVNWSKG